MPAPIPSANQTLKDPGTPTVPDDTTADAVVISMSSLGTPNTIYSFRGSDTQAVRDTLGVGAGVEYVVHHLIFSGGKTVYFIPGTQTAGTHSAVTASGGGPAVTLTGAPLDDHQGIVKMILGGILGTSTFQYSLDGGDTWSDTIATAATYAIPDSGTTLNFAAGTYVAAETYSWTSTGPTVSNANFGAAMDVWNLDSRQAGIVHAVFYGADAAATLTLATTAQSKAAAGETAYKYYRVVVDAPPVDKAGLISAFVNLSAKRVMVCAGFCEMTSDISSRVYKRSAAWAIVPQICKVGMSIDASRNDTDTDLEALPGIVKLVPDGAAAATGYHDEGKTPGLNAARFACLMTHVGKTGFYICNPNLMAPAGSDFDLMQFGRVMDRALQLNRTFMLRYLSKRLRVKTDGSGFIEESEAVAIEDDGDDFIRAGLTGHAVAAKLTVTRNDNLLTNGGILRDKVRVIPFAYAKTFESEIGFAATLAA